MKALILNGIYNLKEERNPLILSDLPIPEPGVSEILIKVCVCAVCHTELDEIEGRTPPPAYPVIPGHQVVGKVVATGKSVTKFKIDDRVGVGWIYYACGTCEYCKAGLENLCFSFKATGRDSHGGYAEYMKIDGHFAHRIPDILSDEEAAPLFCAGAIGFRSYYLTGLANGSNLGLTGFGASGHLVLKMVKSIHPKTKIFVYARNVKERSFAMELGANWAGDIGDQSGELMDGIIDTTPVWKPVLASLSELKPGGRLVINAIRKEETDKDILLSLDYPSQLWLEKEIKTVTNVTSSDITNFLKIAEKASLKPELQVYKLRDGNNAIMDLKEGNIRGAKVLKIN